jgi:branched-chain amino acid transport system substrate-binding protein
MKKTFAFAALAATARRRRFAQDKNDQDRRLSDQSGLYADLGGGGSTIAAQMAVEDSGLLAKGWKIEVIGRPPEQADVGSTIARSGSTSTRSTSSSTSPNSGVALAVRRDQRRRTRCS